MKKKISQELKREVVDSQTGEFLQEVTETSSYVEREPDYVKLYIQDILRLQDLPKISNNVLMSILKRMGYNQQIVLIAPTKRQIAKELKIELGTVSKTVEALCKKEVLIREDRGVYIVNPFLFGRGKWEDVRKIRLTIEYSAKGKMFLRTEMESEQEQFAQLETELKAKIDSRPE